MCYSVLTNKKGGRKMEKIHKIKKVSSVLFILVCLVLLWVVIENIRSIFFLSTAGWNAIIIINTIVSAVVIFTTLILALAILHSTRAEETPFNVKNAKRLKAVAAILVIFEPYLFASQWLFNHFTPIPVSGAIFVRTQISLGGVAFAAGLVVYCVALVFEYGIFLQTQVDETL